jgi:hypothetical protein
MMMMSTWVVSLSTRKSEVGRSGLTIEAPRMSICLSTCTMLGFSARTVLSSTVRLQKTYSPPERMSVPLETVTSP